MFLLITTIGSRRSCTREKIVPFPTEKQKSTHLHPNLPVSMKHESPHSIIHKKKARRQAMTLLLRQAETPVESRSQLRTFLAVVHRQLSLPRKQRRVRAWPWERRVPCSHRFRDVCEKVLNFRGLQSCICWCDIALPLAAKEAVERGRMNIRGIALSATCECVRTHHSRATCEDALVIRRWHVLLWVRRKVATIDAVLSDESKSCSPEAAAK
jgi:hypothetical protein